MHGRMAGRRPAFVAVCSPFPSLSWLITSPSCRLSVVFILLSGASQLQLLCSKSLISTMSFKPQNDPVPRAVGPLVSISKMRNWKPEVKAPCRGQRRAGGGGASRRPDRLRTTPRLAEGQRTARWRGPGGQDCCPPRRRGSQGSVSELDRTNALPPPGGSTVTREAKGVHGPGLGASCRHLCGGPCA